MKPKGKPRKPKCIRIEGVVRLEKHRFGTYYEFIHIAGKLFRLDEAKKAHKKLSEAIAYLESKNKDV